jgi:hypothetical protein
MKTGKLIFFVFIVFLSTTNSLSQTIIVSGIISSNTTWSADTVKIIGDVTVESGVLLTITQGTYVESQGYYKIDVLGRIKAIGTVNDSVVFTVHDTTSFWSDTTSTAGGWAGINISGSGTSTDTSEFLYCRIQFAKRYDTYGGNIKGGAICAKIYRGLVIKHSYLTNNMVICYTDGVDGAAGGAVFCKNVTYILIEDNCFKNNRSFDDGGAVHIDWSCNHTIISNNLFLYNKACFWDFIAGYWFYGGSGAAVKIEDAAGLNPEVCNNQCYNNRSPNGMIYINNINAFVYNNVICNNSGVGVVDGHGLSVSRIFNNTIANNYTRNGGIMIYSRAKIYNNICWRNEQYSGQQNDQINVSQAMTNYELFYNCVQYGNGGDYAVYEYPEFVNPTAGVGLSYNGYDADWSLSDSSPCVNRGTPDTTGLFIPDYDVVGNPRIYGGQIEIGSYENQNVLVGFNKSEGFKDKILVYPNPGTYQLNIKSHQSETTFEMFNVFGQVIIQKHIIRGINSISTEFLNPGIYFYRLLNNKKKVIGSGKWNKNER